MVKTIGGLAVAALLALALPGSASATDSKRADGLTNDTSQATEFSSRHRRWHRPRRAWRHGYRRHYGSRYYGDYYAYAPYPYYRRHYGPRVYGPGFSFGFGF